MLFESQEFICNNELGKATGPTRGKVTSIINLTFTTTEQRALYRWIINDELVISCDHELIVFHMANLNKIVGSMETSQEDYGWAIRVMSEDEIEIR